MIFQLFWEAIRGFFNWFVTPALQVVVTTAIVDRATELLAELPRTAE